MGEQARPIVFMSDVEAVAEIRVHLRQEFEGLSTICGSCDLPVPPSNQWFEGLEPLMDAEGHVLPKGVYRRDPLGPSGTSHIALLYTLGGHGGHSNAFNLGYLDEVVMDWRTIRRVVVRW